MMHENELIKSSESLVKKNRFLDKFTQEVEGFNKYALSIRELRSTCTERRIELIERPFRRLHGIAIEDRSCDYVYVNQIIPDAYKIIAGYHELFHILNHVGDGKECLSYGSVLNLSKNEFQAQAVGVVALMPDNDIRGLSIEDVMRVFDVSRKIAEFRFRLTC